MYPSRNIILLCFLWTLLGVAAGLWSALNVFWVGTGVTLGLVALLDLFFALWGKTPLIERQLPGRFASGVEQLLTVVLRNPGKLPLKVIYYEGLPKDSVSPEMPWVGKVPASASTQVEFPVTISKRGLKEFTPAFLQVYSPLRLWLRRSRVGESESTRVYPNYEPVLRYALLAMANRTEQMGIVKKNRAGLSREFHQLRDYQLGDMLSQIDWKATSKRVSLISRDYQEQRDQTVILAVDCGRRMRALDGGIPQFDHCLNAMLLLAYTALRQGDHVGVIGISGADRWLAPVKGVQSITTILNHLYDYETSAEPSDFSEAAQKLMTRQRRRALVVILSNIRGEDGHQIVEPMRMIRQRHVTILANLREESVVKRMNASSETLDDALEVGASSIYLAEREKVLAELRAHGLYTVDSQSKDLPIALANAYLGAREQV